MALSQYSPAQREHVRLHALVRAGPFRITHKSYGPGFAQGWHEHEEASVDFVLRGAGVGNYAGEEIVSVGGVVECFAAGVRHRFTSGAGGIRTLHVVMPDALAREYGVGPGTPVRVLEASRGLGAAWALLGEVTSPGRADPLVLESLAMDLMEHLGRDTHERPGGEGWVSLVREMLIEAPGEAVSLGAIAQSVGRHRSHVARHFKLAYGVSVGEFARRVRVGRAARLLACERRPALCRVAQELGFSDQAHFTRVFRSVVGCTPGAFRRRLMG